MSEIRCRLSARGKQVLYRTKASRSTGKQDRLGYITDRHTRRRRHGATQLIYVRWDGCTGVQAYAAQFIEEIKEEGAR